MRLLETILTVAAFKDNMAQMRQLGYSVRHDTYAHSQCCTHALHTHAHTYTHTCTRARVCSECSECVRV